MDRTVQPASRLAVTDIGEFIRHHACERRFKLRLDNSRLGLSLPFSRRLFNPIDPVLQAAGAQREDEWERSLIEAGLQRIGPPAADGGEPRPIPWDDFLDLVRAVPPGTPAYARQVSVQAGLGAFRLAGHIDFVLLHWCAGRLRLRLVECKASRRDQTYHRVQVALYRLMIRELLTGAAEEIGGVPLTIGDIDCVVARIDEGSNMTQAILALEPLSLATVEADLERLLAPAGPLARIAATDLDAVPYQLGETCDDCVFNVNCLPESARLRRLELIGIDPGTARALRAAGVTTLDHLATLDLDTPAARGIRMTPGFSQSLEHLRARAASRTKTLPGGSADPDAFEVLPLPSVWHSQLPPHENESGERLVRVYLEVNYDYVENRIGAVAAHVTRSDGLFHTPFSRDRGATTMRPDSPVERRAAGKDAGGKPVYTYAPVEGRDVLALATEPWTGDYAVDSAREAALLERFFRDLVAAMRGVAGSDLAAIHFYVWNRDEVSALVEACARTDSRLLAHLRELLGCRESLEQLIFSTLSDETDRRYALGWTGRGLAVVSSLMWFGRRFHWQRRVGVELVDLDRVFEQDIFDFRTTLRVRDDGTWAKPDDDVSPRHRFEIRGRFRDSLKAPYWRARWGALTVQPGQSSEVRAAIERYNRAAAPGLIEAYLVERVHALRWIEESIAFKNKEIEKPPVALPRLPEFTLGVAGVRAAAVDFLQIDQQVKVQAWISRHLYPPSSRVPLGRTLPVKDVVSTGKDKLTATIALDGYGVGLDRLSTFCSIGDGAFVRLTRHGGEPDAGQSAGQLLRAGATCIVENVDWEAGTVELTVRPSRATRYQLSSWVFKEGETSLPFATLDESPSDFVAARVEKRLGLGIGQHVDAWLDPVAPHIPEQCPLHGRDAIDAMMRSVRLAGGQGYEESQIQAVVEGLESRIQALQGPPGTGKTTTTALAVLARVVARRRPGDVVLVAAHTHIAVDTLLASVAEVLPEVQAAAEARGWTLPPITVAKAVSGSSDSAPVGVERLVRKNPTAAVKECTAAGILIVGGTTAGILQLAEGLNERLPYSRLPERFQTPTLIVDESSMMVFPHFLALASLVSEDGEIMLAGDQRQLSPIVANDWDREERPPIVRYQPFVSAIEAVQALADVPGMSVRSVRRSALAYTFRLPADVRDVVARLYRMDGIELHGPGTVGVRTDGRAGAHAWERVWQGASGLFLVVHDERESRQSNGVEAAIIERILGAAGTLADDSVAIVTPHRAQRTLLKARLAAYAEGPVRVIDTVERLQGGQRPVIIVSATASDPAAISATAEFILGLNRANVAFSRAQSRLIVVCSASLLDHIAADVEQYQEALLWKSLREVCGQPVGEEGVEGYTARVFTP